MKYDLSVLIPARNEMFLSRTVQGILDTKQGKTEIIVVLDGKWANPPLPTHPDLTIVYLPESIGQRAATNLAARLSQAKYVMKLDAHCALDEGFDVKMMAEMKDHYTMIPTLYNLHAFDWVCKKCGNRWYQSPTPKHCMVDNSAGKVGKDENPSCDSTEFERDIIFKPRLNRKSWFYRFDKDLHFQYWNDFKNRPEAQGDIAPSFSAQGSCFMLTRERYWALDICDENHGSWGQQGTEVAMKTWLSGGELMINKKTWYSHMFRTQGGDFGFPYPISGKDQDKARAYSKQLFGESGHWDKALPGRDLHWLLEKFRPVPDWHNQNDVIIKPVEKGIIFYTDNKVSLPIAHSVQDQLRSIGLPIVSASLKPMDKMGKNIHIQLERGWLAYFTQILTALEASTAKYVFMCEHDVLYHPSHFEFTPPRDDVFYYNLNVWKIRKEDGFAVKVDVAQQVSGLCANRELLVKEYRNRLNRLKRVGTWERGWGNEPGTKNLARGGFSDLTCENWSSPFPNLDIRGDWNLTINRWSVDKFRNKDHAKGWTEGWVKDIPGWKIENNNEFYKHIASE